MKVSVARILWAVASAGLAVGANMQLAPTFTRAYDRAQYELKTGAVTLQIDRKGAPVELPLANVHLVTTSFTHVGKVYDVRELSLRAADDIISTPRLQLFATLPSARGQDPAESGHNPALLRGRELPLERSGYLGSAPSYFVLAPDEPLPVISGTLRFDSIEPPPPGEPPGAGHVASGTLRMQVETEDGVRSVQGRVEARLVWDAD